MLDEFITLWRYRDLPEALIAQSKLESAALPSLLVDDNIVRLDWFISNAVGGVKLQTDDTHASEALALLSEGILASFTAEEIGEEYRHPTCPSCSSLDVGYESFYKDIALMFLWFGGRYPYGFRALGVGSAKIVDIAGRRSTNKL